MSFEHRSDLVGSGDCKRSTGQLYNSNLGNGTYDCSGGDTLLRQVIVSFLERVHGTRKERCVTLSHIDRDEADTRTRDQVSVKARVAVSLAHTILIGLERTMVQRSELLLPHPSGCEIAGRGLYISTSTRLSGRTGRTSNSGDHLLGKYLLSRIEVPGHQPPMIWVCHRGTDSLKKPLRALLIRLLPHKESPYDKSLRV
jgi:hypothetical protein